MKQRGWRRFALAAPMMLAVIIGADAVRAQAVDQATAEELRQALADQQRQIDQQQRQLEAQSSLLDALQQQVEALQQSGGRATTEEASVFREVARQRARGQEEGRISGTPPNRLGRIIVHRAGKNR